MADTLQAAFEGYPWTDWVFPADDRAARLRASFALYLTASHQRARRSVDDR